MRDRTNHTWQRLCQFCNRWWWQVWWDDNDWWREKATSVITVIFENTTLSQTITLSSTLFYIYDNCLLFCTRDNNFHILCPINKAQNSSLSLICLDHAKHLANGTALKWKADRRIHMLRAQIKNIEISCAPAAAWTPKLCFTCTFSLGQALAPGYFVGII